MSLIRLCVIVLATALMSACQTNSVVLSDRELVDAAATSPEKPEYEEFVTAGQALPIQSVVDVNGETVDLTATDKRKLVILFATWFVTSEGHQKSRDWLKKEVGALADQTQVHRWNHTDAHGHGNRGIGRLRCTGRGRRNAD